MVIRVEPTGEFQLFPDAKFEDQFLVLEALADHTDIPVPSAYWFESDPSILGAPFFVMSKVTGRPAHFNEEWLKDLTVDQSARVWWSGLQAMAGIHKVDWERLGLGFLNQPELGPTPVEQQLTYYRTSYESGREGSPHPVIEAGFEWLEANKPVDEPVRLLWGDARLGNLLFDQKLRCSGVLDWEMCALGNPESDLAWWLFNEKTLLPRALGPDAVGAFPDREETISRFEEHLGRRTHSLAFYEVFTAVRNAVILMRIFTLWNKQGMPFAGENVSETVVAELLGLEPPRE
jgi:aminoglycoside phosphotransferase (APT) family kinase protein